MPLVRLTIVVCFMSLFSNSLGYSQTQEKTKSCMQRVEQSENKAKTMLDCIVELEKTVEKLKADGRIIKTTFTSGNGGDPTNEGRIASRLLRFHKTNDDSDIRISYTDNFRVRGVEKACRWTVKIDGIEPCENNKIMADRYEQVMTNNYVPSTIVAYCTGLKSGWRDITVFVSTVPHQENKWSGQDCYTGWAGATWTIEATELYAHQHNEE